MRTRFRPECGQAAQFRPRTARDYRRALCHCNRTRQDCPMTGRAKTDSEDGLLKRIAAALERLPPRGIAGDAPEGDAFVWEPAHGGLIAVRHVAHLPLHLLKGVDQARDTLLENTRRFSEC